MRYSCFLLIAAIVFSGGCAGRELIYYEVPRELTDASAKTEFMTRYSPYFSGKVFFLDPGHGGSDRYNVGKLKLVTEADANLYVSLALKDFLQEAGARVIMSRVTDTTVALEYRSVLANKSGADFFISVHHNAPGQKNDTWTNYTSTYYHATEKDYEYEPGERDLARYIQRDLAYAMRNSGGLGSFDGTYSDYWIYPGMGFSVLRITEIPSVLVECGFFTNNFEERRLAVQDFNRIQAWGIFRGIARYLSAGIPEITFLNENNLLTEGDVTLNFFVKDSSGIDETSFRFYFDSVLVKENSFDTLSGIFSARVPSVHPGEYSIRLICANNKGNHSLPFHRKVKILKP